MTEPRTAAGRDWLDEEHPAGTKTLHTQHARQRMADRILAIEAEVSALSAPAMQNWPGEDHAQSVVAGYVRLTQPEQDAHDCQSAGCHLPPSQPSEE